MAASDAKDLHSMLQGIEAELKLEMQKIQNSAKVEIIECVSQNYEILQSMQELLTRSSHHESLKSKIIKAKHKTPAAARATQMSADSRPGSASCPPHTIPQEDALYQISRGQVDRIPDHSVPSADAVIQQIPSAPWARADAVTPLNLLPGEPGEPAMRQVTPTLHKPKPVFVSEVSAGSNGNISFDASVYLSADVGSSGTPKSAFAGDGTAEEAKGPSGPTKKPPPRITAFLLKSPQEVEDVPKSDASFFSLGGRVSSTTVASEVVAEDKQQLASVYFGGQGQQDQSRQRVHLGGSAQRGPFWKRVVTNPSFDLFSAALIACSTALVGVETDYSARNNGANHDTYKALGTVMLVLFTSELVVRILASGRGFLTSDEHASWNIFDTFMVLAGMVENIFVLVNSTSSSSTGRALRVLRVIRITRAMRLGRIMEHARTFRQIVFALQSSVKTLFWAMVVIMLVVYCFAIAMCQAATFHLVELRESPDGIDLQDYNVKVLAEQYNNIPNSLNVLFKAMTGGVNWGEVSDPISSISPLYTFIFLLYVSIMFFGVLNIVTAIFVETAMQSQQHCKDLLIEESVVNKRMCTAHLKEVFQKIDHDNSGFVSSDEVEYFLTNPQLNQYLESIDIFPNDAHKLFSMLDSDGSGEVSIDEFCDGCFRLKGEAKAYDIHCLLYSNQKLDNRLIAIVEHLGIVLDEIEGST